MPCLCARLNSDRSAAMLRGVSTTRSGGPEAAEGPPAEIPPPRSLRMAVRKPGGSGASVKAAGVAEGGATEEVRRLGLQTARPVRARSAARRKAVRLFHLANLDSQNQEPQPLQA